MDRLRRLIIVFLLGLAGIFVQGTVLKSFLPDLLLPNMILSLVVFLAFYENSPFGAFLVFLLGLEVDLYSGHPLLIGPTAGAYVATYGLLSSLSQRIFVESSFAVFIISGVAAVLCSLVHMVLIHEFNHTGVQLFSFIVSTSIVTAVITPALFRFFRFALLRKGPSALGRSRSVGS